MSAIIRRRLLKNRGTKLYFYGKELVTWTAVNYYNGSYVNFGIFTKLPRALRYQENTSGGSREGWYKKGWASPKIDVTNAQAMVVVFDNDFTIPTLGAYPSMIGFAALSSLTDTSSSNNISTQVAEEIFNYGTEMKAGKPYRLDLTGVTGEVYLTVYFGIRGSGKNYTVNISEIYLEEIGEATDDTLPADFYDNGVLPIMPEADKELKSFGPSDIISFPDGDGLSLASLKAYVEPMQDLHGYASPWPAGGGKNKLAVTLTALQSLNPSGTWTGNVYSINGIDFTVSTNAEGTVTSIKANGTASGLARITLALKPIFSGTMTLNGCPSGGSNTTYQFQYTNMTDRSYADNGSGVSFTQFDYSTYPDSRVVFNVYTGTQVTNILAYPMLSVSGGSFAPYSNICPISGWTGASGVVAGRNLIDKTCFTRALLNVNGAAIASNQWITCDYIRVEGGENYTISGIKHGVQDNFCVRWIEYDRSRAFVRYYGNLNITSNATWSRTITLQANTAFVRISVGFDNTTTTIEDYFGTNDIKLEKGSSVTDFDGYATVYPITWTDEAGTVYCGVLNVTTGVLKVTHKGIDLGSLASYSYDSGHKWFYGYIDDQKRPEYSITPDALCSIAKATSRAVMETYLTQDALFTFSVSGNLLLRWLDYTDPAAFKTAVTGQTLVYELATPLTFQLEPNTIRSLIGENNVWVNTGQTELSYYGI